MRHKCVNCKANLDLANRADNGGARAQLRYCCIKCKQQYKNKRYYRAHREQIIARVMKNNGQKRKEGEK